MAENTAEKARTVSLNPKEVPKDTMREIEDPTLRKKILTLLESAGIKNGALRLYWEPGKIQISFLEEHSTHPILELELRGGIDYTGKGDALVFRPETSEKISATGSALNELRSISQQKTHQRLTEFDQSMHPAA